MTVEIAVVISVISLIFTLYQGIANLKRSKKNEDKKDASELTTVIVKLENIGNGVAEIKSELSNVKLDIKENRERIIKVEESTKQAHKRIDGINKNIN